MQSQARIDALAEGTILHAYRIKQELGSGAFGITYLAEHTLLNTLHVIKEYLPETALRDHASSTVAPKSHKEEDIFNWGMSSFFNEARILNQLSHPNIVKVSDLFEANGTAYFVMPYLKGITLHDWIKQHPNPNQQQLEQLFIPLLEGLAYIHERNLLHRDIKPENIYITENGTPVLIDFGAARLAIGNKSKALTQVLTPHFAPWEQYRSKGDFTPALDLYSLAGCMYQAIAQTLPEEAPNRLEHDPQPRLAGSSHEGRFARHFLESIDVGLNVWAKDRFQTASEFQHAMTGGSYTATTVHPSIASSSTPEQATSQRDNDRKRPILLASIGIAVVAVFGAVYLLLPSEDPETRMARLDTELWEQAESVGTEQSYQSYLDDCNLCARQDDADEALESLRLARVAEEEAAAERRAEEEASQRAAEEAEAQAEADRIAREEAEARATAERERRAQAEQQRHRTADNNLWNAARETNSVESYRNYLTQCQLCDNRADAQQRIQSIQAQRQQAEEQARREEQRRQALAADSALWDEVVAEDTESAYRRYLADCRECADGPAAQEEIRQREEARANAAADAELWTATQDDGSEEAWANYVANCITCEQREAAEQQLADIEANRELRAADRALWETAVSMASIEGYSNYLDACQYCAEREVAERRRRQFVGQRDGFVVAPSNGDFSSIQEAIEFALRDTEIKIRPGQYNESIRLRDRVNLVGDGDRDAIIIESTEGDGLYFNGEVGKVENLTIRVRTSGQVSYGVFIDGGALELVGNDISSRTGSVVAVNNAANPKISNNVLSGSRQSGIVIYNESTGTYEGNEIRDNEDFGIRLETATSPSFRNNTIENNQRGGVIILDRGEGVFESNRFLKNGLANILITADGNPTFIDNDIAQGLSNGVFIFEGGLGVFRNNRIVKNEDFGIRLENQVTPEFLGNEIAENQRGGVLVMDGALGEFRGNSITRNQSAGVLVTAQGNPTFIDNQIFANEQHGVHVFDQGEGRYEDNDIYQNPLYGFVSRNNANPSLINNRIYENREGVGFLNEGGGQLRDNDIRNNELYGVIVRDDSNPRLVTNRIRNNQQGGIAIFDEARGEFTGNEITNNAFAGVLVATGGNPIFDNNRISQSEESGLFIRDNASGTYTNNEIHDNGFSGIAVRSGASPTVRRNKIFMNREGIRIYDAAAGTYEENEITGNISSAWDITEDSTPVRRDNRD
ncbi:MAG: right-handed parallel beta-helix repeat-containing protein [Idiomarina sp.]|nr:right-handed parallel beta-helix repeat-containing protein [Idiomarina sp.]